LLWDVYYPSEGADRAPLVLVVDGGGWRSGSRALVAPACAAFAARGFVAIAPEYRLLGEAPWPAPIEDLKSAIQQAHLRFKTGVSGARPLFLCGNSAGAQLALLAGSDAECQVSGVAAFFAPTRLDAGWGKVLDISDPDTLSKISPLEHAHELPPTIIFAGDADPLTPAALSRELYDAMRKAGRTADLQIFADLIHEFVSLPGMMDLTVTNAVAFFRRTTLEKVQFDSALEELRQFWTDLLRSMQADGGAK
jgi:acetyl esterase/lipase